MLQKPRVNLRMRGLYEIPLAGNGGNPCGNGLASHRGESNNTRPRCYMLQKSVISSRLMGHLTRMKTLTLPAHVAM